jgi:hypothetical protein
LNNETEFTGLGLAASIVTWSAINMGLVMESGCAAVSRCGGFDLLLFGFCSVAFLAPAYFVGQIISSVFGKK